MFSSYIKPHRGLLLKTIWPRKLSGVGKVTGTAAVLSDIVNFITNNVIPPYFLLMVSAVVFIFFCRRLWVNIHTEELPISKERTDFYYDDQGENTRFLFLVMVGFMLIWVSYVTMGTESLSERLLKKLNIIEGKVDTVHDKIIDIEKLLQTGMIIKDPNSAEEYFVNVRLLEFKNTRQSWETLTELYDRFGVGKMDSAEIFLRLGKQFIGRKKTRALMQGYFDKHNDPALLYHLNFSIRDPEERRTAFKKMREAFPEYAPSYLEQEGLRGGTKWWNATSFTDEEKYQRFIEDGKVIRLFVEKTDDLPTSNYYYTYPPNWESLGVNLIALSNIRIESAKRRLDQKKKTNEIKEARRLKSQAKEEKRKEERNVKPEISDWVFNKGVGSKEMGGSDDFLHLTYISVPKEFSHGSLFRYQFEGHKQVEVRRAPRLFANVPAKGIFILNWQDRDGIWHGPFKYPYDTQQAE